jgi:hypothetical protein
LTGELLAGGIESGNGEVIVSFQPAVAVPEPGSAALLGTVLIALGVIGRRRKKI